MKLQASPSFEPLAVVTRGGLVESVHHGLVVIAPPRGHLEIAVGNPATKLILRSAGKPFQVAALVESGAADVFGLTDQELAIAIGSHGGAPEHVAAVTSLMDKCGISDAMLGCGIHPPFDKGARVIGGRIGYTVRQNNCSGKHAAMLAGCLHLGLPTDRYLDPQHPWQLRIGALVARHAAIDPSEIETVTDGCSAPSFVLPALAAARAYAALAEGSDPALRRVRDAAQADPLMIAGEGRLETDLMRAAPRRLIAKSGAEGVYALALQTDAGPRGVVLKIADGDERRARNRVAIDLAATSLSLDAAIIDTLVATHLPSITTLRGVVVGDVVSVWDSNRSV
ncbi:MAG: asparaginase [Acidobacteriota bacterium]